METNNRFKNLQEKRLIDENEKLEAIRGKKDKERKRYKTERVQCNFYIEKELDEAIRSYCDDNDTTRTKVFVKAVKEFLNDKGAY